MGKRLSSVLFMGLVACGGGSSKSPDAAVTHDTGPADAPVETLGPAPDLAVACADQEADIYTLPANLPQPMTDAHRGDVFHCAKTESLSAYKVNEQINAYNVGYPIAEAGMAKSGFWTYRIAYRSERNTVNAVRAEGDMAAYVLVPEKPLAGAPLVVFGHGSVGVAAKCAPTHLDLTAPSQDQDFPPALYRLAGAGYTVISPDYAGFSYGQAPGYFNAEDEAHAILDATRAASKVLPTPPAKVVFVGHSQGGHAVLAAQAYAASYGHDMQLVGVAAFAPFWLSLSLFGAATTQTAGLMTSTDVSSILYSMEYAYSAGQLRDVPAGTGSGADVFQTAKQAAAIDTMLGGECYDSAKLQALGATPPDFFDSTYVSSVGDGCSLNGTCSDALSAKWQGYWINDRPTIDANGAPMLVMFGGMDAFITTGRAACARKRIDGDLGAGSGAVATVSYCINSQAAHRDLVRTNDVDYVLAWIAARAGIGSDPTPCTPPLPASCPILPKDF